MYIYLLINILSIAFTLAVTFVPESPIRILAGLPLILFFPGYTLVCVLFPKKGDLDEVERVVLSFGLSIAVTYLIGLALNYTPFGMRLYSTLTSLFIFNLPVSILAMHRKNSLPVKERYNPLSSLNFTEWRKANRFAKFISACLIVSIVVAGGLIIHVSSSPKIGERFTEFYILGPNGLAEEYSTDLTLGESGTVTLGLVNHEYGEEAYKIVIRLDNEIIAKMEDIALNHDERWERNFSFTPEKTGENMKFEFLLYNDDTNRTYRSLHLRITVRPQE